VAKRYQCNVRRGAPVEIILDGTRVTAFEGETLATVLLIEDKRACYTTRGDQPRMMFCNMGACFECRVRVTQDGTARWVLACMTAVVSGMQVETGVNLALSLPGVRDGV
jgi:sarcosine oxidase subunit alpha